VDVLGYDGTELGGMACLYLFIRCISSGCSYLLDMTVFKDNVFSDNRDVVPPLSPFSMTPTRVRCLHLKRVAGLWCSYAIPPLRFGVGISADSSFQLHAGIGKGSTCGLRPPCTTQIAPRIHVFMQS
jgi:hypothetical protein